MNTTLTKLEFCILYDRFDATSDWSEIEYDCNKNEYKCHYYPNKDNIKMLIHDITVDDNIITIKPKTLSRIYETYEYLNDYMDMYEENSKDYYRMIFNMITKDYYVVRALTDKEKDEYIAYQNKRAKAISEKARRELEIALANG